MDNDLTPARTLGLLVLAVIVYAAIAWAGFYDYGGPVWIHGANCTTTTYGHCPLVIEWMGFR